ncbi:carbohydrate ABC transporter permease [Paenibacillus sacheonensis]|uniref:ABC transporter permease subunit n=1 Tax=Paenibacillus sacheonensis TaxID=742054 RepID=A0A7X5BWN4_9BACL|nr:carbohydrate ABC transporter permease [Paenibacillus sacheonensis]MBM7563944.1 multiple sugar transport system permease protein [Paenibacillus sacheonensis]NBC67712.1 ABC transporter permease subunit [Paenibacillus sacheonensis]
MKSHRIIEKGERKLAVTSYAVTVVFIILGILPLVWMLLTSMMDNESIDATTPKFLPDIPRTIAITLDYSGQQDQNEEFYRKDAMKATWFPWMANMRENIGEIKVTGVKDGHELYNSKTTAAEFYVGQPFIVPTQVFNDNVMKAKLPRIKESGLSKFTYYGQGNKAEIEKASTLSDQPLGKQFQAFFSERKLLDGKVTSLVQSRNWLRLFDSYRSLNILASEAAVSFGFYHYFFNSLLICVIVIAWQLTFGAMASYALSQLLRSKKTKFVVLMYFLATIMIPGVSVLIPQYLLMQKLNLVDNLWAVILPHFAWGFVIFLFKGFFDQLPKELLQAARVDGASELRTFLRIVIPMSVPVFTIVAVMTFIPVWNDFLWPYVVTKSHHNWTFTVAMNDMQGGRNPRANWISAGGVVSMIPLLLVFLGTQGAIEKGINFTGIKG